MAISTHISRRFVFLSWLIIIENTMKTTIQVLVTLLLGALVSIFALILGNYDNSRCNVSIIAAGVYVSGYVAVACILGIVYISVKNGKQ
jgi:hypothetical protein